MRAYMKRLGWTVLGLVAVLLAFASRPAHAQLQFSTADGSTSLKLGVLGQMQAQSLDTPNAEEQEKDLYLRRVRLLGLFKMGDKLSVYFDTDAPNYGKGNVDGTKNSATTIYLQDFVVTYSFAHEFQLEGGEILVPTGYNHLQSAGQLMPLDYGPFSFTETTALQSNVGRDWGAQVRGYLANDHLEYRLGMFQGVRGIDEDNSFRYAGRLALWIMGAQTGLFYRGTSLGKTQSMEFGGSFDRQKEYSSYTGDFFWDQPIGNGDGFTAQFDYTKWDGGTFAPTAVTIPKQHTILGELGYYLGAIKTQPFFQYSQEKFDNDTHPTQTRYTAGLGYYFVGHSSDVKFAYTKLKLDGAVDRKQLQLQYQIFLW
jgi:hypothetical protein